MKSEKLVPWDAAPLVRAAQEFIKKYESTAATNPKFPDAIQVLGINKSTNGVYVCSGYINKRPLYVRGDNERCIRWLEDSWYVDTDAKNDFNGIAKLEIDCPHPAVTTKGNWLIYDSVTS